MPKIPETTDEYLATLDAEKRGALQRLRRQIRAAAPRAEECISYRIPTFRLNGKMLVSFAAFKNHCAFYPGAFPIRKHRAELEEYESEKGTIRFQPDDPLPEALVKKLVKARLRQQIKT